MDFDANKPIYLQIIDEIKSRIVSARYAPGEKLPSLRDFAAELSVNPNTMQRALAQLEAEGLIYTERTNGRFVSKDVVIIGSIKDEQAIGCTKKYLREMHALDYHREEIHRLIDDLEVVQTKEEK